MARALPLLTALALAAGWSGTARGLELSLPAAARSTAQTEAAPDSYAIPTGPYADGALPVIRAEGRVSRRAWQIPAQGLTTLQIIAPLRQQVRDAGFEPLLECADSECGGFDFRYAADVFDAPAMHVDLFDYRVLTARRGEGETASYLMLLASKTSSAGYLQMVLVTPQSGDGLTAGPPGAAPVTVDAGAGLPLAERLEAQGHAALSDLDFATGSAKLTEGSYASLAALAAYLAGHPDRRVALVGHTDTEGSLDGNIALSRLRAQSVAERLVEKYGTAQGQLDAEGMGYLSPVASNLTPEGREANRRVEAVLLNTQ
ncbi:membrane protein [Pseudooceanicola nanhaiensis]|jgi:OOP family OmpA-OmpF porin|uniref:Membrane protein n=1 Tax=Pseudooceanicola nanhaiensis TaxID=375761 RepID=A0A917WKH8_9RHOB|nr:OmpA family protein [Pseudooceanicola nanhaiensis]GGM10175.1 membrane protein [Pseudooceanicola nanhaiensis]